MKKADTYVISDQFDPPLYYQDGSEWTYDAQLAKPFDTYEKADLTARSLPYINGRVVRRAQ
jgi:hypothetical protein